MDAHRFPLTKTNRFDLVIFHCDGVLVDSERITNQVFCAMLNEIGLSVTLDDMFERFVGQSMQQCVVLITQMLGAPPPDSFVLQLRARAAAALTEHIKPIPGVAEMLKSLTVPYCVASSGEHEKIRLTLGATGLLKYFENRIFSVTDVEKPKPAPDVFCLRLNSSTHRLPAALSSKTRPLESRRQLQPVCTFSDLQPIRRNTD